MKRHNEEINTKIIFLAQKLLSVHYSGMYLTAFDIATIAEKIGYDSIHKTWYWTSSPWDSGKRATFDINNLNNK